MSAFYKFLFPMKPDGTAISLLLLALRLLFGGLLLSHGIQKWTNFERHVRRISGPTGSWTFGFSRLGPFLGSFFVRLALFLGALYRLAMIPMIFTMGVAFFVIHGNDPFSLKELAFVYLVIFILMYIAGPGKFSLDRLIAVLLSQKR